MTGLVLRQRVHKWVRKKTCSSWKARISRHLQGCTILILSQNISRKNILIITSLSFLHSSGCILNWIHSTSHLVYYFICILALYYPMLNFRWIDRYLSEMQLHHLPPGIFGKNMQLIKLWVKLFFLSDTQVKIIQDRKLNNINKICKSFIHNM